MEAGPTKYRDIDSKVYLVSDQHFHVSVYAFRERSGVQPS